MDQTYLVSRNHAIHSGDGAEVRPGGDMYISFLLRVALLEELMDSVRPPCNVQSVTRILGVCQVMMVLLELCLAWAQAEQGSGAVGGSVCDSKGSRPQKKRTHSDSLHTSRPNKIRNPTYFEPSDL